MLKKIASVSAVAAMLVLGGCSGGGATHVTAKTTTPTGSNAKLQDQITAYADGHSTMKESANKLEGLGLSNSPKDLGIDLNKYFFSGGGSGGGYAMSGGESNGSNPCVDDGIVTTDTNTSATAKGTLKLTDCMLSNGTKINASVTVDFTANGNEHNFTTTYSGSGNLSIVSSDSKAKIVVSEAKTEGDVAYDHLGGHAAFNNKSGISAYLEDNGKKFLILDGVNADTGYTKNDMNGSYTFTIAGFVGSDDIGMLELATPVTVKGTHNCPSEGKITLTDASGSVFTAEANGTAITTSIDGNVTGTHGCSMGGGSSYVGGSAGE